MVRVIAIIQAKPGLRAQVLEAHRANLAAVLAEDGCIEYEAFVDDPAAHASFATYGPDAFVVVERWASLDALDAHGKSAHMRAHGARIKEWVDEVKVHVMTAAG